MRDIVIIGGGPAGLTAAIYAIHKRLDVLIVTRDLGGKTNYALKLPFVERYQIIHGDEIVSKFRREIEYLDFVRVYENAERIDAIEGGYEISLGNGQKIQTRSVIVASGARPQMMGVPGETDYIMRGIAYSAISYSQLFIDRTVAVVGDGELALRAVAELARIARNVQLVASEEAEIDTQLGRQLNSMPNVEFLAGYRVIEVKGDEFARSLMIAGPNGEKELEIDGIFVEKDLVPRSEVVGHLVDLNDKGQIVVGTRNETSAPGIFAAGDVTDSFSEQVLIAVGEGAKASLSAYEYLLRQDVAKAEGEVTMA